MVQAAARVDLGSATMAMKTDDNSVKSGSKVSAVGRTLEGQEFLIPETVDMFHTLTTPALWGFAECLTLTLLLAQVLSALLTSYLPRLYYIGVFAFWRLAYNIGLGILLYYQSRSQVMTRFISSLSPDANTLLAWAVSKSVPKPYEWSKSPPAFNSWIAFRALATLILANDGLSYAITALSCFTLPSQSSVLGFILVLPVSLILFYVCALVKSSAHDTLGDYGWYWGDFFFLKDSNFSSSGVLRLFPHPMYTVGYGAYYAAALGCRSYLMLLVSLLAHLSQIAFLYSVEEPHTNSIYGTSKPLSTLVNETEQPSDSLVDDTVDNAALRLFEQAAPHPFVNITLICSMSLILLIMSFRPPPFFAVLTIAFVIRILYWYLLAIFVAQPLHGDNRWVTMLRAGNTSHSRIFVSWQMVFLISTTVNHALFVAVALTAPRQPFGLLLSARPWALMLAGIVMIVLGAATVRSARRATGHFTYYFGDFFVQPEAPAPVYTGSYAYLNHPEAYMLYLVYYGVAVVLRSPALAIFAAFCQLLHIGFIAAVEAPHIAREYPEARLASPLVSVVCGFPAVEKTLTSIGDAWRKAWNLAVDSGVDAAISAQKLGVVQMERLSAECSKSFSKVGVISKRHVNDLLEKAHDATGRMTCDQIIHQLRRYGNNVKDANPSKM